MDTGAPGGESGAGACDVAAPRSASSALDRDRGRWCSPDERMKGSLDSSPPAPDVLRFRVTTPDDRFDAELGESAPLIDGFCSIGLMSKVRDRHVAGE